MPSAAELDRLCVVLVATRNPLNLGAAARAMSNFGFLRLRVVNPYDVAFREARSAVGAAPLLAQAKQYPSLAEAVADCSLVVGTTAGARRDPQLSLRPLEEGARELRRHLLSARAALLFGSEKRGLANQDFSHCHWLMRIPTRPQHASMNLAQAVAVCLYELVREEARAAPPASSRPATAAQNEQITTLLFAALGASGYVKPRTAASSQEKIRRLVRRLNLDSADATLCLGMLRQIVWKLERK